MKPKKYDNRLTYDAHKEDRRDKKLKIQRMAEAERARFEAKNKGEPPKIYINYGISDIDPFTNIAFFWDLWVKFPLKLPKDKEKLEKFTREVQKAFEQIFLR